MMANRGRTDRRRLARLLGRNLQRIQRVAARIAWPLGIDPEDLCAEAMTAVLDVGTRTVFANDDEFVVWMGSVLRNLAVTARRKISARQRLETQVLQEQDPPAQSREPLAEAASAETVERLHRLIQALEPRYRAVLVLYLEGLKTDAIARALGTTRENVRQLKSRAIQGLKRSISRIDRDD